VFCICDEFEYIRKKLKDEEKRRFSERISWVFFRKYKTNLERTPVEYIRDFYHRMAEDLRNWNNDYGVRGDFYYQEEWEDLQDIVANPMQYLDNKIKERKAFVEFLNQSGNVVIYGAGKVGKALAQEMDIDSLVCFVVTNSQTEDCLITNDRKIEVKTIKEIANEKENITLVIGSKIAEIRKEMLSCAKKVGFSKVMMIPYGAFDV
jgi:hypothetical protein